MPYLMLRTGGKEGPAGRREQRGQVLRLWRKFRPANEGTRKIPCLTLGNNRRRSLTLAHILGTAGDAKQSQHSSKSYGELLHNKVLLSAKKPFRIQQGKSARPVKDPLPSIIPVGSCKKVTTAKAT
jgi:hypothetical protein